MYSPNWRSLTQDKNFSAIEALLPDELLQGRQLIDLQPVIADLPFYNYTLLVAFEEPSIPEPNKRYFLWSPKSGLYVLDWTNDPIYLANAADGMSLTVGALTEYAQFFFHFVRGQLGRFIIIDSAEQIVWLDDSAAKEHGMAKIEDKGINIAPIQYIGVHPNEELHVLQVYVMFKNALFRTKIYIAPYPQEAQDEESGSTDSYGLGQTKLVGGELLLEDLPVPLVPPPGEFG